MRPTTLFDFCLRFRIIHLARSRDYCSFPTCLAVLWWAQNDFCVRVLHCRERAANITRFTLCSGAEEKSQCSKKIKIPQRRRIECEPCIGTFSFMASPLRWTVSGMKELRVYHRRCVAILYGLLCMFSIVERKSYAINCTFISCIVNAKRIFWYSELSVDFKLKHIKLSRFASLRSGRRKIALRLFINRCDMQLI